MHRSFIARLLDLVLVSFCAAWMVTPTLAQDDDTAPRERLKYDVSISGVPDALEGKLKSASRLYSLRDRAPFSDIALERRAEADIERLNRVLESEGYYDGRTKFDLNEGDGRTSIEIVVAPGAQYVLGDLRLDIRGEDPLASNLSAVLVSEFSALRGQRAVAANVIAQEDAVIEKIRQSGFPKARRVARALQRDASQQIIAVETVVDTGPFARYGQLDYRGLERTKPEFLDALVPWSEKAAVDPREIDGFATELRNTSLFGAVTIFEPENVGDDGAYDLAVEVSESAPRSVSAGVSFSRDKGIGGSAGWTHRNLFGRGERLGAKIEGDELEQTASVDFLKPAFLRRDQSLESEVMLTRSDFDAFDEESISIGATLRREFPRGWIARVGVGGEIARLSDVNARNTSYLLSVPVGVARDKIENFLDPLGGYRFDVEIVPYIGSFAGAASFARAETNASLYHPLDDDKDWIVAGRVRVASILGQGLADIPQNQRLYAGGGGSVRGYEFQFVGPLTADNRPTGGRSAFEASLELRGRISRTFGVAPFVDAGAVSASSTPLKNADILIGAGIGLRYYTEVGPLRLDLAIPVDKRSGVDQGFQFYISFGQAF